MDKPHPVIDAPFSWRLIEFTYRLNFENDRESTIDMTLERKGVVKRLRFRNPKNLEISEGTPNSFGMEILDISKRQLEGLKVRVTNFEQSWGAPTFWAASVEEIFD